MIMRTFIIAAAVVILASCGGRTPESAPTKDEPKAESAAKEAATVDSEPAAPGRVTLSEAVQRRLGIVTTAVSDAPLPVVLKATGSVQPVDSRVAHVRPLAHGRIQSIDVKVGDRVERGQQLATFDNIEAGEAAARYDAARADLGRLRVQLAAVIKQAERARKLAEIGAVPQKDYEAALAEQQQTEASVHGQEAAVDGLAAQLKRYGVAAAAGDRTVSSSIRAPFAGVVIRATAAPGDVVDAASELLAVADISRVYVQAQIYEKDLGRVRVGQVAAITVDAYPGMCFSGRVTAIGDSVDPQTRTVAVRCEVANGKRELKLDMLATVDLPTTATERVLAIPPDAIQTLEDRSVVFVKTGDSTFVVRPVAVGRATPDLTEVTHGLNVGDIVVTRGAFQVKSALLSKGLGEKEKE
jgi:cobalt-zinc-cadmium efflux system membrane fusion protein